MDLKLQRSHFYIYNLFPKQAEGQRVSLFLKSKGYESFWFTKADELFFRMKESAPHVVVLDLKALEHTTLNEFVQNMVDINPEVQFVVVGYVEDIDLLMQYRPYGLSGYVKPSENYDHEIFWTVDQVCEQLYFKYQNEQLIDELVKLRDVQSKLSHRVHDLEANINHVSDYLIEKYELFESAESREHVIQKYFDYLYMSNASVKALFFKYMPTVQSLVATQVLNLDVNEVKGVGCKLSPDEITHLAQPGLPKLPSLKKLLDEAFGVKNYDLIKLNMGQSVEGVVILWPKGATKLADHRTLQLVYEKFAFEKKSHELDIKDAVSDMYSPIYYFQKLEEEVSRARRIEKAVSTIRFQIDGYQELKSAFGEVVVQSMVKSIGGLIKKTGRVNDLICRLKENEFAMILPHCTRKGASLRAERLRRMIETHGFTQQGVRITITCGVSEYPSLCASAQELDATAAKALSYIITKGENRVCLYKVPSHFKPDFLVES